MGALLVKQALLLTGRNVKDKSCYDVLAWDMVNSRLLKKNIKLIFNNNSEKSDSGPVIYYFLCTNYSLISSLYEFMMWVGMTSINCLLFKMFHYNYYFMSYFIF